MGLRLSEALDNVVVDEAKNMYFSLFYCLINDAQIARACGAKGFATVHSAEILAYNA
jgi:hypothetical protein